MRVWRRDAVGSRQTQAFIDVTSKQGAVEVGGGPWWSTWSAQVILALMTHNVESSRYFTSVHMALEHVFGAYDTLVTCEA